MQNIKCQAEVQNPLVLVFLLFLIVEPILKFPLDLFNPAETNNILEFHFNCFVSFAHEG